MIVGSAIVGRTTAPVAVEVPQSSVAVDYVPRPSPWAALPSPTLDPATLEGAGALAATAFVIPPPRWLAGRPPVALTPRVTARVGGLGWRTDAHMK